LISTTSLARFESFEGIENAGMTFTSDDRARVKRKFRRHISSAWRNIEAPAQFIASLGRTVTDF
jgi:hypothetical protein